MRSGLQSAKSKLKSKLLIRPQDARLKHACSTAVGGLQATLQILKEVAGVTGVPGLQAGIGAFLVVLDVVKVCRRLY
jgi:hypothetical protein